MKVIVTGANGQLGSDVVRELNNRGLKAIGMTHAAMDITNGALATQTISQLQPDAVINCAAYTAVDAAQDNQALCYSINVTGALNLAKACASSGCKLMYISSDYVFGGEGERPFETDDQASPLNIYGQTKYAGEVAVQNTLDRYFIVRTSWLFGVNGSNFIKTMLNLQKSRDTLSVVANQIGSPTSTVDLSRLLVDMIQTDRYGVYHATNEGFCSWYDLACEVFRLACVNPVVHPVTSDTYVTKAQRPMNSRLSKKKLTDNGFDLLPTWQDATKRYLEMIL